MFFPRPSMGLAVTIVLLTWTTAWIPAAQGQSATASTSATAIFAGGCFWCMEPPFDNIEGVLETRSGYIGGHVANPTYEQVSAGKTGHAEALKVTYDPAVVSYEKLLTAFWHNIDPMNRQGQFCDKGRQYRSAIFYTSAQQKELAEASKEAVKQRLRRPIATEIEEATEFYDAEEYHQDYYTKNPLKYKFYRYKCGRDARLDAIWGSDARQAE